MATWAALARDILIDTPGCPQTLAEQVIREAATEFCDLTQVYISDLSAIDVVAGTATYTLTVDSDTEVSVIRAAWYDGLPLAYAPLDALNPKIEDWRDTEGAPLGFTHYEPKVIKLFPKPDTSLAGGLKVQVALRPTAASVALTDWIVDRYGREILAGARARLFTIPNKAWSNPAFVAPNRSQFMFGVGTARAAVNRSHTRGTLMVQMRSIF